jgi:organic hydroperoxide reductase OsmC/OhrA
MRTPTENPCDFRPRMGDRKGTNPEELLGPAHAGCFSLALAFELTEAGLFIQRIHTGPKVDLEQRESIVHPQDRSRSGSMGPGSRSGSL